MDDDPEELFSFPRFEFPKPGRLIGQFVTASREWGLRTGDFEHANVSFWGLYWTGGLAEFERVDAVNTTGLTKKQRSAMSMRQLEGRHTLEQLEEWLTYLVEQRYMYEPFLIKSLVVGIASELESVSENYGKGIERSRMTLKSAEERLASPEGQAEVFKNAPDAAGRAEALLEWLRKMATPSLRDMKKSRDALTAWQDLTSPIIEPDNLSADIKSSFGS
jgi:hypothetical protein